MTNLQTKKKLSKAEEEQKAKDKELTDGMLVDREPKKAQSKAAEDKRKGSEDLEEGKFK